MQKSLLLRPVDKARLMLREVAVRTHSKALQEPATEISTLECPYDKLKAMFPIQKNEDAHKNCYYLEIEKNNELKYNKYHKMELSTIEQKDEVDHKNWLREMELTWAVTP